MNGARISVRVPYEVKKKMDCHPEINWSEIIRQCLQRHVQELSGSLYEKVLDFLSEYKDDLEMLWLFHMYLTINPYKPYERQYVLKTAELVFSKDLSDTLEKLESDLKGRGLVLDYNVRKKILDAFESSEFLEPMYSEVVRRIKEAPYDLKRGIWLLEKFVDINVQGIERVHPEGLNRVYTILVKRNDVKLSEELVKLGLLYVDYYESNAYSHWWYIVPGYALDLLAHIKENPSNFDIYSWGPDKYRVADLLREDKRVLEFLRWMEAESKWIPVYNEEDVIKKELKEKELDLSLQDFNEVRRKLIEHGVLIIEYSPHRRRTGRRSSEPAEWIYKITKDGLITLGEAIFEVISLGS